MCYLSQGKKKTTKRIGGKAMKLSCDTIRDMLPLVADDLASKDTVMLVNEHIKDCKECKQEYEEMKEAELSFMDKERIEAIPLKNIKRKIKSKNIYIGFLTFLIVSLIALIGVDKATKPIPLSYNEAIKSIKIEDDKAFINFTPEVSNYQINSYGEFMAWKTIIDKLDKSNEPKNTVVYISEKDSSMYYIDQKGALDTKIYGKDNHDFSGQITLPRLAMNYYVFFMGIILFLLWILLIIFRKKDRINKLIRTTMLLPISYIIANVLISGIGGSTHHIIRDLSFVVMTTILIFGIFISLRHKDNFIK